MRPIDAVGLTFLGLVPAFVGCNVDRGDHPEAVAADVAVSSFAAGTLPSPAPAATLQSGQHTFHFFVSSTGRRLVTETAPIGATPILNAQAVGSKRASEIYELLSNGAPVPSSLSAAEASAVTSVDANLQSPSIPSSPPTAAGQPTGNGPRYYTAGDQAWFDGYFCPGSDECITSNGYAAATLFLNAGRGYEAISMNGSEATANRAMALYEWTNTATADGVAAGTWNYLGGEYVGPGYWNYVWAGNLGAPTINDNKYYWYAVIGNNGLDNAAVSLTDYTLPWVQECEQVPTCSFKDPAPCTDYRTECSHVWPDGCIYPTSLSYLPCLF